MRSQHADYFNHDDDAPGYDADVQNEDDPIRAGYAALLAWIAEHAVTQKPDHIVELGTGTGNLTAQLAGYSRLYAVDVSGEMLKLARQKLAEQDADIQYVQMDLLEFYDSAPAADAVVSAYTIHHLTEAEKVILFDKIYRTLRPGGVAIFGDLMFENAGAQTEILQGYTQSGRAELAEDIQDEFFWNLETCQSALVKLGFVLERRRFSELSWGVLCRKPADSPLLQLQPFRAQP